MEQKTIAVAAAAAAAAIQHPGHQNSLLCFLPTHPFLPLTSSHTSPPSADMSSAFSSSSVRPSHPQNSNFSINRILEEANPTPGVIADSPLLRNRPLSPTAGPHTFPLALHQQHKSLLDTARMLWLHQQISAQHGHHSLVTQQGAGLSRLSSGEASDPHKKFHVAKKRKLGRNPRIPFTQEQINSLEKKYCCSKYLSSLDVVALSKELDLSEARVKIWFQNRRARERRDKKLDSCSILSPPIRNEEEILGQVTNEYSPAFGSHSLANLSVNPTNDSTATINSILHRNWKYKKTGDRGRNPTSAYSSAASAEISGLDGDIRATQQSICSLRGGASDTEEILP